MKLERAIALSFFELPAHVRTRAVFLSIRILHNFESDFLFILPIAFYPEIVYTIDTKRKEIIKMAKICPVWAEDCPHFKRMCINGEWDCYCELSHPEEDCDDYIYYNGEDEED